jgi:hypothetical protein
MSNGYVPGVSQAQFGVGLGIDSRQAQKDAQKQAKKLKKYGAKRGLLGKLGGKALDFLGTKGLTTALAGAGLGPLAPFLAKAITKGGGQLIGSSRLLSGSGPKITGSSTGLNPNEVFDRLEDVKGGMDASFAGQALGTAGAQFTGDAWKKILPGLQMDTTSFLKRATGTGASMPTPDKIADTSIMDEILPNFQEGGGIFNVDVDSIADYARAQKENMNDPFGRVSVPDISDLLREQSGEMDIRRDYKVTPEKRAAIERTTDNRNRIQGIMSMLDRDKMSPIDDTESAYQKSLAGSNTMGRLAGMDVGAQEAYGGGIDNIETHSAYQKSLPEARRLGDLNTLEQMKQGIQSAVGSGEELSQYKMDDIEPMAGMKNPFTGEELSELKTTDIPRGLQDLIPAGTYTGDEFNFSIPEEGMQQYLQGQTGDKGIVDALEFATRRPDRSLMDKLLGRNKPRETQKGDSDRLRKLMGDENYFMMPDRKYEDEIQQLLQGFQMGGMPGVSSPLPYNMGGSVNEQPMSYRIGGLLKYKRNPMVG